LKWHTDLQVLASRAHAQELGAEQQRHGFQRVPVQAERFARRFRPNR